MSPERVAPKPAPRSSPRPGSSGGFHRVGAELSPHAAAEQFEQHDDASAIEGTGLHEMRSRLGATTKPVERPLNSAADSRRSKLACGARVSVMMIPSSPREPERSRAVSTS